MFAVDTDGKVIICSCDTENGNEFYKAFEDPDIQKIAWDRYGFRTGITGGSYDVSKFGIGVPKTITSTVSSLKMDIYNKLNYKLKNELEDYKNKLNIEYSQIVDIVKACNNGWNEAYIAMTTMNFENFAKIQDYFQ